MPEIVEPTAAWIEEAARRLAAGGVVAFPTETVYGLGASTFDRGALATVYELKGRPADNPLIAHVLGEDGDAGARRLVTAWDERCRALAERFWPGPFTLVLPRAPDVPPEATAGRPTIAVRAPRHEVARRMIEAFGGPVSAPSANRSGHVSATTARHVADDFERAPDLLVLDGGRCEIGLESTVLDLTADPPRVLRPGAVTEVELREILGAIDARPASAQAASPGTSLRHYAPWTPAELVAPRDLAARLRALSSPAAVLCFDRRAVPPPHHAIGMPQSAGAYARRLYEALREADDVGAERILIEMPPASNETWKAVGDRLERAVSGERPTAEDRGEEDSTRRAPEGRGEDAEEE